MELALKLDQSTLNDRAIRVSRCKKNPKPFRVEEKKTSGKEKENGKESGAYKRIKNKEEQEERKKGSGWITKMKKRNKESYHKSGKGNSFAGETTGADSVKVLLIFSGYFIENHVDSFFFSSPSDIRLLKLAKQ